jgi:adenylate cyclase
MDFHTDESYPHLTDALRQFRTGLMNYRQMKWEKAMADFADVLALNAHDKAAQIYVERCQHFIANPPPPDWDGVWVMESK